jgi:sugar (pentulose or hexulose) kinase
VSPDTVVVIDAGTSSLRAVAVTRDGNVSLIAAEPWPMFVPGDAGPYGRELRFHDTRRALRRLIERAGALGDRVAAIATCGQREGVVFCDAAGAALLISPNIDARAAAEGMTIDAAHGVEIYRMYGRLPSLIMAPAKMRWLRSNRPRDAERVRWVLPLADWLGAELCGERIVSRSLGPEIGVADVRSGEPAGELVGLLPPLSSAGMVGTTRTETLTGTPVTAVGADTQAALLGLDAVEPGACGVIAGWSAPVQLVTDRPSQDDAMRVWIGRHVLESRWVVESNAADTGRAWQWACDLLQVTPATADACAARAPGGANDTLSILGPRAMNAAAMNAGVGAIALPLPIVMAPPTRSDVLRAVLEGIACSIRANVEQTERTVGAGIERIAVGGGMSASPVFTQMLADVLGRPLAVARTPHTAALGAAALAFADLHLRDALNEPPAQITAPLTRVEPDQTASAVYEDIYGRWCEAADRIEQVPL